MLLYLHFQGTAVRSRETQLFRTKLSAGVRDKGASCTVLLTHALCAGATVSTSNSVSGHAYFYAFR